MLYIIHLIAAFFGSKTAAPATAAEPTAEPTAAPTPALGWESVDTAPDNNWVVIEFGNHECEDFVVVLGEREYMTYSRTRKYATVKTTRGGFTAKIDLVRHYRNGYCVGTKAVLAGGMSQSTFQAMVNQGHYNDVKFCEETIQFLNW